MLASIKVFFITSLGRHNPFLFLSIIKMNSDERMQISDMGMAFLMQGFAFILAIVSIVLADYLTKKTGQIASRSVRAVLWASFVIITSVLLISSNALMIGSVHHPEITSSIVTCILLGFCGFISLSKDSVSQNPIHPE